MTHIVQGLLYNLLILSIRLREAESKLAATGETQRYYFEVYDDQVSHTTAKGNCQGAGGWLVEPRNKLLSDGIQVIVNSLHEDNQYHSGLERDPDGIWRWENGTVLSWSNWESGEPIDGQNCMGFRSNMEWLTISKCSKHKKKYICQYDLMIPLGPTHGYHFELSRAAVEQSRAKEICAEYGGWLTEPKTESISDAIGVLLHGMPGYYYGGLEKDGSNTWRWKDGDDISSWSNWRDGEPKNNIYYYCMVHEGGMVWASVECEGERKFLCQYGGVCEPQCLNNGTCLLGKDFEYRCHCAPGSYGTDCGDGYCETYENPCKYGRCDSDNASTPYFNCICNNGYYGDTCEEGFCDVMPDPCMNNGTCNSLHNGSVHYECKCTEGYYGNRCEQDYCDANPHSCTNEGSCIPYGDAFPYYACNCSSGYYGYDCSDDYCEVAPNACMNDGKCISTTHPPYYDCNCTAGYFGEDCTKSYCEANLNACRNGGNCTSKNQTDDGISVYYECDCTGTAGYYGQNCTDDYCDTHPNPCQNGGTCNAAHGAYPYYQCQCQSGYYGNVCEDNYCDAYPETCWNEGTCILSPDRYPYYECNCKAGYYGQNCTDEYCDVNSNPCSNEGVCNSAHDAYPYYVCDCKDGYYGDICEDGYCEATTNPCWHEGQCNSFHDSFPYFECICSPGYYGDICQDEYCNINPNACSNEGVCISTHDADPYYVCDCRDGYYGNTCEDDYCDANPKTCMNEGNCLPNHDVSPYYECDCSVGYYGENCADSLDIPIFNRLESDACSADGIIKAVWTPAANGIAHRLRVSKSDTSILSMELWHTPPDGTINITTTFNGLSNSEEYDVEVIPCPKMNCDVQVGVQDTTLTGPGLPPPVDDATVEQSMPDGECIVVWSTENWNYMGVIERFKVSITEELITTPQDIDSIAKKTVVSISNVSMQYNSQPLPNRQYYFSVVTASCAGDSESAEALGSCFAINGDMDMVLVGSDSGYEFEKSQEKALRSRAREICEEKEGWLAEPKSKTLSDGIYKLLHEMPAEYYSGLKKDENGIWKWKDGDDISSWNNWKTGEPGNDGDCMVYGSEMVWSSVECEEERIFLCQYSAPVNDGQNNSLVIGVVSAVITAVVVGLVALYVLRRKAALQREVTDCTKKTEDQVHAKEDRYAEYQNCGFTGDKEENIYSTVHEVYGDEDVQYEVIGHRHR